MQGEEVEEGGEEAEKKRQTDCGWRRKGGRTDLALLPRKGKRQKEGGKRERERETHSPLFLSPEKER